MAVNRQDPDFLSNQVDSAAESMRQTEKAVSELQHLTGLADQLEEPPPILETDLRGVLRMTPEIPRHRRPADLPGLVPAVGVPARRSLFLRHDRGVRAPRQHLRPLSASARRRSRYGVLAEFLAEQLFGRWSLVLHYDLGRGLRAFAGRDEQRLKDMVALANRKRRRSQRAAEGSGGDVRRSSTASSAANIMAPEEDRLSVAVIMDQASYVFPAGEPGRLNLQASSQLVTMLNWAMSPHVKRLNMAFVLIDEKLADLSDRLTGNPHVATIEVPLPAEAERASLHRGRDRRSVARGLLRLRRRGAGEADRRHFAHRSQRADPVGARERQAARRDGVPIAEEAAARAAVPRPARVHRAAMDARYGRRPRGREGPAARGRGAPEARRARHLAHGVSALRTGRNRQVVSRAVRERRDRRALRHPQELPIEVRRRDRRQPRARARPSLRAMGPVVVVVDEADAALGSREQDGDSGTSSRVFAMIAAQMGDTQLPRPDHLDAADGAARSAADRS